MIHDWIIFQLPARPDVYTARSQDAPWMRLASLSMIINLDPEREREREEGRMKVSHVEVRWNRNIRVLPISLENRRRLRYSGKSRNTYIYGRNHSETWGIKISGSVVNLECYIAFIYNETESIWFSQCRSFENTNEKWYYTQLGVTLKSLDCEAYKNCNYKKNGTNKKYLSRVLLIRCKKMFESEIGWLFVTSRGPPKKLHYIIIMNAEGKIRQRSGDEIGAGGENISRVMLYGRVRKFMFPTQALSF